ncbi:MAG: hypothetical protein ACP5RZ_06255 [Thermoplasmata archaeon]
MKKALKKDDLFRVTDFDADFLDWYFSVQNEKELNDVLKIKNYNKTHSKELHKRYRERHPEKIREYNRERYLRIKNDPEKYKEYLEKKRKYYREYTCN